MNVVFATVSKKVNSTLRFSGGTTYDCILKDGCSVVRPRISLKWTGSGAPTAFNVAYIAGFGRYYFIDDWTFADRQWSASMHSDVLASAKDQIGSASKYILRSASEYDPLVIDTKYPAKAGGVYRQTVTTGSLDWGASNFGTGKIVLSVSGAGNTYNQAGSGYYVVTPDQLQQILNACFNNTASTWGTPSSAQSIGEALQDYGDRMRKSAFNPFQFINSAIWFPFTPATSGNANVVLGAIDTGIAAGKLSETSHTSIASFSVNTVSGNGADAWMNVAPFSLYGLSFLPFGRFNLDSAAIYGADTVDVTIKTDTITGTAHMIASANVGSPSTRLIEASAMVGVPIQLSGYSQNYMSMFGAAVSGAANLGAALAVPSPGNIAGVLSSVGNIASSSAPESFTTGSTGGLAALLSTKYLWRIHYPIVDRDVPDQGRPLCGIRQISTLSGFTLCADGHIEAPLTSGELDEIESYLTGGFYYE